jgi:hypothetical protein
MNNPRQGFVRAKALRVIAVFAGLQCLALAASADPMKSTVKSEWVYIAYPTGGLAYCYSSDMDAANAVIAPAAGGLT